MAMGMVRPAITLMRQVATSLSPAQRQAVADYLYNLAAPPRRTAAGVDPS